MVGMERMLPTSHPERKAGFRTLLPPLGLVLGMACLLPSSSPSSLGIWLCSLPALSLLLRAMCQLQSSSRSRGALLCSLLLLSCSLNLGSWLCRALPA